MKISEAHRHRTPINKNRKEKCSQHTIGKILSSNKESLKDAREKSQVTCEGKTISKTANLSMETRNARRTQNNAIQLSKYYDGHPILI